MKGGFKKGFTLVEVMVAIVLIGIGLSAMSSGLGSMTAAFRRTVEREEVERLAHDKYDELIATGEYVNPGEGEIEDPRYPNAKWRLESDTTSIENVFVIRVTVELKEGGRSAYTEGLVYRPNQDTVTQ